MIRGIENIIAMRKGGEKPSMVYAEIMPMQDWARRYTSRPGRHVDLHIDEKDVASIETADLRCLHGLTVIVIGKDHPDTWRVARACKAAQSKKVEAFGLEANRPFVCAQRRYTDDGEVVVWPM